MKKLISVILVAIMLAVTVIPAYAYYKDSYIIPSIPNMPLTLTAKETEERLQQIADYWYKKYSEIDYGKDILVMYYSVTGFDSAKIIMREYCANGYNLFNIASSAANEKGYFVDEALAGCCKGMENTLKDNPFTKEDFYDIITHNYLDSSIFNFGYESPDLKFYGYLVRDGLECLVVTDGQYRLFIPVDGYYGWDNANFVKKKTLIEEDRFVGIVAAASWVDTRGEIIDYRTAPYYDPYLIESKIVPSSAKVEVDTENIPADTHKHTLNHWKELVECEYGGHAEYWECLECRRIFADAEATEWISGGYYDERLKTPPVGHIEAENWTLDETYHWKICERCNRVVTETKERHNFEDGKCTVCGYEKKESVIPTSLEESSVSEQSQTSEIEPSISEQSQNSEAENSTPSGTETTNTPLIIAVIVLAAAVVALIISLFAVSKKKKG